MKTMRLVGMAAMLLAVSGCTGGYQQTSVRASYRSPGAAVGVSYFYDELAPYGRWIEYSPHGWCWTPYEISAGWRPYSNGYWVYSEYGWTWASYEPWGWASYHYGRWLFDPVYGWLWVPGTVWGPAWVAWHYDDAWVGWAPLPPAASWDVSVGLRFGDAERIPATHWCFVNRENLVATNLRVQVVSVARNVTLLSRTRDATRFAARGGRPVNVGIDVALVERMSGRPVQRMKVVDADSPGRGRGQHVRGGAVQFFRPEVRETGDRIERPRVPERDVAIESPVLQRRQELERRKLEQTLAQERVRLEREHERELRFPPRGAAVHEIRGRQVAEKQAFEGHAAEQRQVLEQRFQKRIVKPERAKDLGEPGPKQKGKGKGKEKGVRGEG